MSISIGVSREIDLGYCHSRTCKINWAYLEDETDHLSKTNIICFGLGKVGEKMDNPSNFMYGDRPSCGLEINHILGMWVLKRFAQLASPDSATMPSQSAK